MSVTTNGTNGTVIRRAPFEGASRFGGRNANPTRTVDPGETDFYLHRSYAIVERLRRAVAERDTFAVDSIL